MVRMLVDAQANIQARNNGTGCVPLHDAARHGNLEVVKTLLELGAPHMPRSTFGELPIDYANEGNHRNIVTFLGKKKINQSICILMIHGLNPIGDRTQFII